MLYNADVQTEKLLAYSVGDVIEKCNRVIEVVHKRAAKVILDELVLAPPTSAAQLK